MSDGWQTFLRMANLYNPEQMGGDMPSELPVAQSPIPQQQRDWSKPIFNPRVPDTPWGNIDEEVTTGPPSTLEAFRQNVLNPPERRSMTYPKNTLAGLEAALKIASEKTDFEKNRVFVNGDPYQQVKAFKDPTTGEVKFINKYKQPGFMEQVMKAMPAAVSPAVDILNQRRADELGDWDLRNKALASAVNAESQMALAQQRQAQAAAIPRNLDIKEMDARTRQYLASLKDLPESEKQQMLQDGRMSIEAYRAQARYSLQELRGEQATALETQRQAGRIDLEGVRQRGRASLEEIKSANDQELEELRQDNRVDLETRRQAGRELLVRQRAEQSRLTKAAPSGSASAGNYPTQQRVALQNKAAELVRRNPEWADYISYDENGFPVVAPAREYSWQSGRPTEEERRRIINALDPRADVSLPAPGQVTAPDITPPPTTSPYNIPGQEERDKKFPPKPVPTNKNQPPKQSAKPTTPTSGKVRVVAPDGKTTGTWDYSKGPLPQGFRIIGGQ